MTPVNDEQPPKGLFTRGFASKRSERVIELGLAAGILGLVSRSGLILLAAIAVVLLGTIFDLTDRAGHRNVKRLLMFACVGFVVLIAADPPLAWQWMGELGRGANYVLSGGR